jgi:hypothetical protein
VLELDGEPGDLQFEVVDQPEADGTPIVGDARGGGPRG